VSLPYGLWNQGLSLKGMGLLYTLLGLSNLPNWEYSLDGLATFLVEGKDAIRSGLQELEKGGFLMRDRDRGENGRLEGATWIISDHPMDPEPETPTSDSPTSENPTQYKPYKEETKKEPLTPCRNKADGKNTAAFSEAMRTAWNDNAPGHWPRIRDGALSPKRLKAALALVKQFGGQDEAVAALVQSLRQAWAEDWCMKPGARLTWENWFSNDKILQHIEKARERSADSQEPVQVRADRNQQEIIEAALASPYFSAAEPIHSGQVRLSYTEVAQQALTARFRPSGPPWPAQACTGSLEALEAELKVLSEMDLLSTPSDQGLDTGECPW
jgi:hypothetical protein